MKIIKIDGEKVAVVEMDFVALCSHKSFSKCSIYDKGNCPHQNFLGSTRRVSFNVFVESGEEGKTALLNRRAFAEARDWEDAQPQIAICKARQTRDPSYPTDNIYWGHPQPVDENGRSFWND